MPRVRIALITFRRADLLPRAIESLRNQTLTDWVCDVHNGDPADPQPGEIIRQLNDARFQLRLPAHRTGPVEAFNLAHTPALEPYQTLLEDDNWWEPTFLERMVAVLEENPDVKLAWANMRFWVQEPDGRWTDKKSSIWDLPPGTPPLRWAWPQMLQLDEILYSNGSTLFRSEIAASLIMPTTIPRDMLEQIRERMLTYPIILMPEPLGNFGITRQTMRSSDFVGWGRTQAMLAAAFVKWVPISTQACADLWKQRGSERPRSTNVLFHAAIISGKLAILRHATLPDWFTFLAGLVRHPIVAWRINRGRHTFPEAWRFLNETTLARTKEAQARGFKEIVSPALVSKQRVPTTFLSAR